MMNTKAMIALVALGWVFGSSFLFVKVIVEDISATELVTARLFLGAATLGTLMLVLGRVPRCTPTALAGVAALGVFESVIPYTLIAIAEVKIDSGIASVLVSTMPIFTVVFAATLPDERLAPRGFLGLAVGFLGVVVLTGGDIVDITNSNTLAMVAVVAAAASYGVAGVIAKQLLKTQDAISLTGSQMAIAAVISLGIMLVAEGAPNYGALNADSAVALVALGIICTAGAFALYFWVVGQIGSVKASLVTYLIPVTGLLLGWAVLGEEIGPATVLGTLLIAAGVAGVMQPARAETAIESTNALPVLSTREEYA